MSPRILVVEDSNTQAQMLRGTLDGAGYATAVAPSAEDALAMLDEEQDFDLMLSDVVMPGISGFELCRRVRDDERTSHIPVLLLTSLRDPMDVIRAVEAGADYFLHKPYDAEKLLQRVQTTLGSRTRSSRDDAPRMHELTFRGRHLTVGAGHQQLLDLLVTTFEDLVETNARLRSNEQELTKAQENLAIQLRAADLEHRHLATLLDSLPDAVFVTDVHGRITDANRGAVELTGMELRGLRGRHLVAVVPLLNQEGEPVPPEVNPLAESHETEGEHSGLRALVRGGEQGIPVSVRSTVVRDQRRQAVAKMAVVRDISAETFTDPITGLASRTLFLDRLAQALLHSARTGRPIALVLLSVERLDLVADSYGMKVRDRLLVELAQRLRAELSRSSTLAHLAADEFGVLLEDAMDLGDVLQLADRLVQAAVLPFTFDEGTVALRANAGVALPSGETDAPGMLQQASSAAHRARGAGEPSHLFNPELQQKALESLALEADLRRALEREEFVVHYQPEVELPQWQVVGTEALVRWNHAERGLVSPGEFMQVAEETGLIVPIGLWVLREACRQTVSWNADRADQAEPLFVAVNLSARQLESDDLITHIEQVLAETGLPASSLMLEITETSVMRDAEGAARRLQALKDLGVQLALDDFGTGYSSMAYLRSFPLDVLKIDMSFVQRLSTASGRAVVRAILSLGEAFGLSVVAEGVETEEQRATLAEMGCPMAAGYLFYRPLPPEKLDETLTGEDSPVPSGRG